MAQSTEIIHPFVSTYRPLFKKLYDDIRKKNYPYIVAIARKTPRIFDLFENELDKTPVVVSDRAIPFLELEKTENLPVIDDVVIFGSTFNDVIRELKNIGIETVPFSLAYNKEGSMMTINSAVSLSKEQVANFSDDVVSAFQLIGKPYDIDHVIFMQPSIGFDRFVKIRDFIKNQVDKVSYYEDLTSPIQRENDIWNLVYTYSPPFSLNSLFNPKFCQVIPSLHKIRIFYNSRKNEMSVTPIFLFQLLFKNGIEGPVFSDNLHYLNEIVDEARKVIKKHLRSQKKLEEVLYRLIMYLVEYIYGLSFLSFCGFSHSEVNISRRDCYYLYSDKFGEYLIKKLEEKNSQIVDMISADKNVFYSAPEFENKNVDNLKLFEEIFDDRNTKLQSSLSWSSEIRSVWNICKLLQIKDESTRTIDAIKTEGRLKFGFNFDDLFSILKTKMTYTDRRSLSIAIDYLIDRGVLIPIFYKYPTNYWVRAFRFGENIYGTPEERRAYFVRTSLERLFKNLKTDMVSQFDCEKFLCYLIQIFKGLDTKLSQTSSNKKKEKDELESPKELSFRGKEFNFRCSFDEFGIRPATLTFRTRPDKDEKGKTESRFLMEEVKKDTKVVKIINDRISLNEEFNIVHENRSNPISGLSSKIKIYTDLWTEIAYSKNREGRKDEIMLTLSTTNNNENFLRTYETGIYSWFNHETYRFSKIINETKLFLKSTSGIEQAKKFEEIKKLLQENAQRLKQSENKKEVWQKREHLVKKIDERLNDIPVVGPNWEEIKNILVDTSPLNTKQKLSFERLTKFYEICRMSTNVLRSALEERDVGDFEKYVKSYNQLLNQTALLSDLAPLTNQKDLKKVIETLEANYNLLFRFFEIEFEVAASESKFLEYDVAVLKYDILGYSKLNPEEQRTLTLNIDDKIKSFLEAIEEDKFFHSSMDDTKSLIIKSVKNAFLVTEELVNILAGYEKYARFAIHFTDPSLRVYYIENRPSVTGGKPYDIATRLAELAREVQKKRESEGIYQNVVFITRNTFEKIPEELKTLKIKGPSKSPHLEGVGELEYFEIVDHKFTRLFGSSD